MIINDFDVEGVSIVPLKTDVPLAIDSYTIDSFLLRMKLQRPQKKMPAPLAEKKKNKARPSGMCQQFWTVRSTIYCSSLRVAISLPAMSNGVPGPTGAPRRRQGLRKSANYCRPLTPPGEPSYRGKGRGESRGSPRTARVRPRDRGSPLAKKVAQYKNRRTNILDASQDCGPEPKGRRA